jgi:predicted nuclease of predicted toxin-antitoxin system
VLVRILVNENMPASVVQALRERNHDVLAVKESMRGEEDRIILARAQAEARLVVTQDKDFGELAFRSRLPAQCGIILFRLSGNDPDVELGFMVEVIESRTDWAGHFTVATNDRIRTRPIP